MADVADPHEVSALRPGGGRYAGAWIVALRDGYPCGSTEVEFSSDRIGRDEMARRLEAMPRPPRRAEPREPLPTVSVVIPTNLARPRGLLAAVRSIEETRYPELEIVVVDNRAADRDGDPLGEMLRASDHVITVRETRPGISAARNAGLDAAHGDVVAFTDDDVVVHRGWVNALAARFAASPDEDALTGLILPQEMETPAQVWFERYYGGFGGPRGFEPRSFATEVAADGTSRPWRVVATDHLRTPCRSFAIYGSGAIGAGANIAFRASALRRIGGFDVALGTGTPARGGEDLAAVITLLWEGGRVGYEPGAMVSHCHRKDVGELRRQMFSYGIGFTAMLSSLVHHDHSHVAGIARQFPTAVKAQAQAIGWWPARSTTREGLPRSSKDYPVSMRVLETAGFVYGPRAYAHSRRQARRWPG